MKNINRFKTEIRYFLVLCEKISFPFSPLQELQKLKG